MDPNDATLPRFAPVHSGGRKGRRGRSAIGVALVMGLSAVAARCVRRVAVKGGSMAPTLLDGDRLLVLSRPWSPSARLVVGDIVAVPDPRLPGRVLVKRVASIDRSKHLVDVLGDAPDASSDSRDFGPVPLASVIGRVVHRYGPPGRSGPIPRPTEYPRV
jgi:nickel-type superoxide dismutase maturation protease